jgi:Ca2+-binding RTX toxin-like protein
LASPSGTISAVTASTVSGTASLSSALYTTQLRSISQSALISAFDGATVDGVARTRYVATTGDDLVVLGTDTNAFIAARLATHSLDGGTTAFVDGGAGTDAVFVTMSASESRLFLDNVELVLVKSTSATAELDISNFSADVDEIWNYESASDVILAGVASTAITYGIMNTSTDTTLVFDSVIDSGTNSTVTVLLNETASAGLVLDTSDIEIGGISTVRLSSNGSSASDSNVVQVSEVSGGGGIPEQINTLVLLGDYDLSLGWNNTTGAGVSGLAGLTTVNASGMRGDFSLYMGNLASANYSVTGGAGTNAVFGVINGDADLSLTRIQTATLSLSTAATVDLSETTGLSKVVLSGSGAAATFDTVQAGTAFELNAATVTSGVSTINFESQGDLSLQVKGTAASTLLGLTTDNARIVSVATTSAASANIGAVTLSSDTQELNLSSTSTGSLTVANVTGGSSSPLIVKYTSSSTGGVTQSAGTVAATKDLYVSVNAVRGVIDAGTALSSAEGKVVVDVNATSANASVGALSAEGDVSISVDAGYSFTAATAYRADIDGNVESRAGNVIVEINASNTASRTGVVDVSSGGTITATAGAISITGENAASGSLLVGGLSANETVHVNLVSEANGQVEVANGGAIAAGEGVLVAMTLESSADATFGAITSTTGDVVLGIDANAGATATFNGATVTAGKFVLGTASVGTTSYANAGSIKTDLASASSISLGTVSARSVDIGGINDVSVGAGANLAFGPLSATAGEVRIEADILSAGSVGGAGANLSATTTTTVDITGAGSSVLALGSVSGATLADVDFVGGSSSRVSMTAVSSSRGSVDVDLTAGSLIRIDSGVQALASDQTVSIDATITGNGSATTLQIATVGQVSADGDITLNITTGNQTTGTIGTAAATTSAEGDVTVTATVNSNSTAGSVLTFGALTATRGDVEITGATVVRDSGSLRIGALTATGSGGLVSIGAVDDRVSVDRDGIMSFGAITANGDITVFAELANNATVGGGAAIESQEGTVTLDVTSILPAATMNIGSVTGSGAVDVDFAGGTDSRVILTSVESTSDSVTLNLTAGDLIRVVSNVHAETTGQTVTINATLTDVTSPSTLQIATTGSISADSDITLNVVTGSNSAGTIGNATSDDGNVVLNFTVNSRDTAVSSLVMGTATSNTGNIVVTDATSVADSGALYIGALTASGVGATVSVGSNLAAISVGPDAVMTVGATTADGDIILNAELSANATVQGGNADSDKGDVTIDMVTSATGTLMAMGSVEGADLVDVMMEGGTGSRVTLTSAASTAGSVVLNLSAGTLLKVDSSVKADGTDQTVTITAALANTNSASTLQIATVGSITADGDITLNLTTGGNTTGSVGTAGVTTSDAGDVTLNAIVNSDISTSVSSTLTVGALKATRGDVVVSSLTDIASTGALVVGALTADGAGGQVLIGSSVSGGQVTVAEAGRLSLTGAVNADQLVGVYVQLSTDATLSGGAAIDAINGDVLLRVTGNPAGFAGSDVRLAAVSARDLIDLRVTGGDTSVITMGALDSDEGDIFVSLTTGDSTASGEGRILINGSVDASSSGSSAGKIDVFATSGRFAEIQIATGGSDLIVADGDVTLEIIAGSHTVADSVTNQIGSSGGIESIEGDVVVTGNTDVGIGTLLQLGKLVATSAGGDVLIGTTAANGTVRVRENAELNILDIEARNSLSAYLLLESGAEFEVDNVTVYDGGFTLQSLNAAYNSDVSIAGGASGYINTQDNINITIVGGDGSDIFLAGDNTTGGVESVEGNVVIRATVGKEVTSPSNGGKIEIGNVYASHGVGAPTNGTITIVATADVGSDISIGAGAADDTTGEVQSSGDIVLTVTTGEGTLNSIRDVVSIYGDIDLNLNLRSSSDFAVARNSTLDVGTVWARDGDVKIQPVVGGGGALTFGTIVGSDSNDALPSVHIGDGTVVVGSETISGGFLDYDSGLTTDHIIASDGDVQIDLTMRASANLVIKGSQTSNGIDVLDGDVTIDIVASDGGTYSPPANTATDGVITFGNINALRGHADVSIIASTNAVDSPTMTLPLIHADTVKFVYQGSDDSKSPLSLVSSGGGTLTTTLRADSNDNSVINQVNGLVLQATVSGSALVELTVEVDNPAGNSMRIDGTGMTETLHVLQGNAARYAAVSTILGGTGDDSIRMGDGADRIEAGADADIIFAGGGNDTIVVSNRTHISNLAESIDGGDGTLDTLLITDGGLVYLDAATILNVEYFQIGHASIETVLYIDTDNLYGPGGTSASVDVLNITGLATGTAKEYIDLRTTGDYRFSSATMTLANIDGIRNVSGAAATIYGSDHSDTIIGGSSTDTIRAGIGNDSIEGGTGADDIDGGIGANTINGGAGLNIIVTSGTSNQLISNGNDGGSITTGIGSDDITIGNGAHTVVSTGGANVIRGASNTGANDITLTSTSTGQSQTVVLGSGGNKVTTSIGADSIVTTSGADTIVSGTGNDTIQAGSGNNSVSSSGGSNKVTTEDGNDIVILTGATSDHNYVDVGSGVNTVVATAGGNDTIIGGDGVDSVNAGAGNDSVSVAGGNNTVISSDGADTVVATDGSNVITLLGDDANRVTVTSGNNSITTSDGSDLIVGTGGNNTVVTGQGLDTVSLGSGNNIVTTSGTGADSITVGSGNDSITTADGSDIIAAGDGNNTVKAGDGANLITIGTGNSSVVTGDGADTITASGAGSHTVTAGSGTDGGNIVTLNVNGNHRVVVGDGADSVTLGTGNSSVNAGNGANTVTAALGDHTVHGGTGNDVITLAAGSSSVIGGGGTDIIIGQGTGSFTIIGGSVADSITVGTGASSIVANEGADTIVAGGAAHVIRGADGNDLFTLGGGNVSVDGGNDNDTINYTATVSGTATLIGGAGDDFINVLSGNGGHSIEGGTGNDSIFAGAGVQTINAGTGSDYIVGGGGADIIDVSAAADVDVIHFTAASDVGDIITGFAVANDKLSFADGLFDGGNYSSAATFTSKVAITTFGAATAGTDIAGADLVVNNADSTAVTAAQIDTLLSVQDGTFNGGVLYATDNGTDTFVWYDVDANTDNGGADLTLIATLKGITDANTVALANFAIA